MCDEFSESSNVTDDVDTSDVSDDISCDVPDDESFDMDDFEEDVEDDIESKDELDDTLEEDTEDFEGDSEETDDNADDVEDDIKSENELDDTLEEDTEDLEEDSEETDDNTDDVEDEMDSYNDLSKYMNDHNYGMEDFSTYSQDPEWRNLMRKTYPDYELPELKQENAKRQLSDYMNEHNYGMEDFKTYSQDPIWSELHNAAFPDFEMPEKISNAEDTVSDIKDENYTAMVSASEIIGVDSDGEHFWDHHNNTKDSYIEIASKLPNVQEQLSKGVSLDEIKQNPDLRDCASAYYDADKMVKVEKTDNGYEFQDDGRHRVAAARELGYDMPINVINDHQNSGQQLKDISEKIEISDHNSDILKWSGDVGNSKRLPKDSEGDLAKALEEFGIDGIEYVDGNVDFSPVSKYEAKFDNEDELYKKLSESINIGNLKTRKDFNGAIRTKWQSLAKEELVENINSNTEFADQLRSSTGIDTSLKGANGKMNQEILQSELSRVGLTLHETPDCKKIQFVPTTIHNCFKHSGGTSEMLERLLSCDIRGKVNHKYNN